MTDECDALKVRITALETLVNEREDRTKERFVALEKMVNNTMAAAEKAISKAELATEKRFDGVNEFRDTLRDQASTFMPRSEYTAQHSSLQNIVNNSINRLAELLPRAEYQIQHNSLVESISTNTDRLNTLENNQRGKRDGLSLVGQVLLAIITGLSAVGVLVVAFFRH